MEGKRAIQNARILIVDDQVANVHLLERILTSAGYARLTSTTDSQQAVVLFPQIVVFLSSSGSTSKRA